MSERYYRLTAQGSHTTQGIPLYGKKKDAMKYMFALNHHYRTDIYSLKEDEMDMSGRDDVINLSLWAADGCPDPIWHL